MRQIFDCVRVSLKGDPYHNYDCIYAFQCPMRKCPHTFKHFLTEKIFMYVFLSLHMCVLTHMSPLALHQTMYVPHNRRKSRSHT